MKTLSKYTKAQRHEIYKKVKTILKSEYLSRDVYICCEIFYILHGKFGYIINLYDFPEFNLFKPTLKEIGENYSGAWFSDSHCPSIDINGNKCRIACMDICIEMTRS